MNNTKTNTLTYIKGSEGREEERENNIKALGKILKAAQIYISATFGQQSHCSYFTSFIYALTLQGKYIIFASQNADKNHTYKFQLLVCALTPLELQSKMSIKVLSLVPNWY